MGRGTPAIGAVADVKKVSADFDMVGGVGSIEDLNLIPVGCFVFGVTTLVVEAVSGSGLTGFDVGNDADADGWGAALPLAAGGKSDQSDYTAPGFFQAITANEVRLIAVGTTPQFDAGKVRVTVHYIQIFS